MKTLSIWAVFYCLFLCRALGQTTPEIHLSEVTTHDGALWFRFILTDPSKLVRRVKVINVWRYYIAPPPVNFENTEDPLVLKWVGAPPGRYELAVRLVFDGGAETQPSPLLDTHVLPSGQALVFLEPPPPQLVNAGTNVTIQIKAVTDMRVRYQWLHEGIPISDATNATLSIPDVKPSDRGYYSARLDTPTAVIPSPATHIAVTRENPGSVLFRNRVEQDGRIVLDAPLQPSSSDQEVNWLSTNQLLRRYTAELKGGLVPEHLFSMGRAVGVGAWTAQKEGYFNGGLVRVPFAEPGDRVYAQVHIHCRALGGCVSWDPVQVSGLIAIQLGDTNHPGILENLYMPGYPEWPDPFFPRVTTWGLQVSAGDPVILREGEVSFREFELEWRFWGHPIPGSRGRSLPPAREGEFDYLAWSEVKLPSMQICDVGDYKLWVGRARHQDLSDPLPVVMLKPAGGRFLGTRIHDGDSLRLSFQGQGAVAYRFESSTNLTHWESERVVQSEDGAAEVDIPTRTREVKGGVFYRTVRVDPL